jgi:cytochrome P450
MPTQLPFPVPFPAEPGERPPEYFRRLAEAPLDPVVLPSGDPARLAVRFADVRELLADPVFSRALTYEGAPRLVAGGDQGEGADSINNLDPPEHTRLRRLISGAFSPRRVARWRPLVRRISEELLDAVTPPFDLVDAYAFPLPAQVICALLDVPDADHRRFRAWSDAFLSVAAQDADERVAAAKEFAGYVAALIRRHRETPGDGLLNDLIDARDAGDSLSEAELLRMTMGLIVTGYETTATVLSRGVLRLLRHPDQYAALCASPDLVPRAVEEILRFESPGTIGLLRVATAETALPSGPVRAGEAVVGCLAAANRDPAKYERPTEVDVFRTDNDHLTFGYGAHFCVGASLARVELQESLAALCARMPGLRLAGEEIPWRTGLLISGPERLLLTW